MRPIAFFHRTDIWGGAEESLLFNATDFVTRGLPVVVLCSVPGPVAGRLREAGLEVVETLSPRQAGVHRTMLGKRIAASLECRLKHVESRLVLRLATWVTWRELRGLSRALDQVKPSVLYANMSASSDYQFLRTAAARGISTMSHQRVTPPLWTSRQLTCAANRVCDAFVSNSVWTRNHWIEAGLRSDRHNVIYNAIPVTAQTSEQLRSRLGLSASARLLASVGRLEPSKQFERGIEAFGAIAVQFPEWHYVIIGEGEQRERLSAIVRQAGLAGRIHLMGEVRNASSFMSQIDLLLHPTPAEHFGRVVAEAMLQEKQVVGHASGGVLEMVKDRDNGFLFHDFAGLPQILAQAMRASGDPGACRRARAQIEDMCGCPNSERLAALVVNVSERMANRGPD